MAKPNPIFLDQGVETNDGSVVGIKEQPNKRTELRGPVPSIAAVNEDILPFSESFGDLNGSFKDGEDIVVPLWICKWGVEFRILALGGFDGFVVGLSNRMDVGDIQKLYFAVQVKLLGFVSFSCYFIAESCYFASGIINHTIYS